jgi:hypothetical protein
MPRHLWMPLLVLAALPGCATTGKARHAASVTLGPEETKPWAGVIQQDDEPKLTGLSGTLARVRGTVPKRLQARLSGEKELLDPGVTLLLPTPPPGPYRCRLIRLGGRAGIVSFPADTCYVEARAQGISLDKQTGSARFGGWLYADSDARLVFLGSRLAPRTKTLPGYGHAAAANVVGAVERVAPFRWRLTLASAGTTLDVYELTPVVTASGQGR